MEKKLKRKFLTVRIYFETNSELTSKNIEKALFQQYLPMNQDFRNFKVEVINAGTFNDEVDTINKENLYLKKNIER